MKQIIYFLHKKDQLQLALLLVFVIICSLISFIPIKLMEALVNSAIVSQGTVSTVLFLGILYLSIQVVNAFLGAYCNYCIDRFQSDIARTTRIKVVHKLLQLDFLEMTSVASSEVINSLTEDVDTLSQKIVRPLTQVISALFSFTIGTLYIFSISWQLALIVVPLGILTAVFSHRTQDRYLENAKTKNAVSLSFWSVFSELLKGIVTIRVFHREDAFFHSVETQGNAMHAISDKQNRFEKTNHFAASSLFMVSIGVILIASALLVSQGVMAIGGMVAILMYNHMIIDPLLELLDTKQVRLEVSVALGHLDQIIDLDDDPMLGYRRGPVDQICINHLSYAYPDKPDRFILRDLDIVINPGDKLTILGVTGSGKSTLVKLISGLIPSGSDAISYCYHGKCVDYLPESSFLYQNSYLFDASILDNICLFETYSDPERLETVLRVCQIHPILAIYGDSPIGEGGKRLSGGECARVRLAAAVLNDTVDLFLFDELSSSLDRVTSQSVVQGIIELLNDKTCIFIEHSHESLHLMDRVVELKDGKLVPVAAAGNVKISS